jgi:hypothetical protein
MKTISSMKNISSSNLKSKTMKKIVIILISCFGLASCEEMELSKMDDVQAKSDTIMAVKACRNDAVKADSLQSQSGFDFAGVTNR